MINDRYLIVLNVPCIAVSCGLEPELFNNYFIKFLILQCKILCFYNLVFKKHNMNVIHSFSPLKLLCLRCLLALVKEISTIMLRYNVMSKHNIITLAVLQYKNLYM